ncbi:MAG: DUF4330 family protein [Candidatus Omnitrophica bacterium]|nr:DUF4330 family protein [Candidatus Omnitrophota bacterium]
MRLVDNKGRLFGIINLIDLLVILLIAGVAMSVRINFSDRAKTEKLSRELYVKVLCRLPTEVANNRKIFRPDEAIMGGNARIKKVLEIKPVKGYGDKEAGYSDVIVLIKAKCVILNGEYYCANTPIKINSNIVLLNPVYSVLDGTILDFDTKAGDKA